MGTFWVLRTLPFKKLIMAEESKTNDSNGNNNIRLTPGRLEHILTFMHKSVESALSPDDEIAWETACKKLREELRVKAPKPKKDPDEPKKNKSAYHLFVAEEMAKINAATGKRANFKDHAKPLGEKWHKEIKSTPNEDRFKVVADEDKKRYRDEMVEYCKKKGRNPNAWLDKPKKEKKPRKFGRDPRPRPKDARYYYIRMEILRMQRIMPKSAEKDLKKIAMDKWKEIGDDVDNVRLYYDTMQVLKNKATSDPIYQGLYHSKALSLDALRDELLESVNFEHPEVISTPLLKVLLHDLMEKSDTIFKRERDPDLELYAAISHYVKRAAKTSEETTDDGKSLRVITTKEVGWELHHWHGFSEEELEGYGTALKTAVSEYTHNIRKMKKKRSKARKGVEEEDGEGNEEEDGGLESVAAPTTVAPSVMESIDE